MKFKNKQVRLGVLLGLTAVMFTAGCVSKLQDAPAAGAGKDSKAMAALKASKPIIAIKEYEKMLFGKMTADYIGNENCLKGCHTHDKLALDFKSSTMGDQLKQSSSGMMIVDCESCHGPGSELMASIVGLNVEVATDKIAIVKAHRENLLDYEILPSGAQSLICLKCHTANSTFNLHNWNGSAHASNDVTCSNCHPIHAGADLIAEPRAISTLCMGCHVNNAAQFSLPSRHPVKEGRMYCTDCHEPHGNANTNNLREMSQRETCGRCHTEKTGPFLYEHADNMEQCSTCHSPHGSINNNLLKQPVTFLCKQCHAHHTNSTTTNPNQLASSSMSYTRCTDCHSTIHGTDTPGVNTNPALGGSFTR